MLFYGMHAYGATIWKKIPFIRLLTSFTGGITVQWYVPIHLTILWDTIFILPVFITAFSLLSIKYRFRWRIVNGLTITVFFFCIGAINQHYKDIRFHSQGIRALYHPNETVVATLDEPPVEKTKSIKSLATISVLSGTSIKSLKGRIIIYFKKDTFSSWHYGQQIIFTKQLQPIKNSGNPGAFDYERYCLSQNITHQVFLDANDYKILPTNQTHYIKQFIFAARDRVLAILRKYIPGDKERGLSEALLIGYKDELDRALVQSYTNTGVVHVIAISGLHLGLIYTLLLLCFKPLKKYPNLKWLRLLLILSGIWSFSFLAGAQPSILRSAVMFTCLALAECLSRRSSMLNSLAFSAFLLLCINPLWLWDAGFQLSYTAVLSIVLFMRPVYNWLFFKNKILDALWKLNAVTIAAQVLTVPICLYHFHQFPNYFLLANIVAVPLSSIILVGEIFLCAISVFPFIATLAGKILSWMIAMMNSYVERIDRLPFSVWEGLYVNTAQVILLYITLAFGAYWLFEKSKIALKACLVTVLVFFIIRTDTFFIAGMRKQLVIYNIPKKTVIDIFDKRNVLFVADSSVLQDEYSQLFHIMPCRIKNRVRHVSSITTPTNGQYCVIYDSLRILFLDRKTAFASKIKKLTVDLVLVSRRATTDFDQLDQILNIRQVVLDATITSFARKVWQKHCALKKIPCHDVSNEGAFVMTLR